MEMHELLAEAELEVETVTMWIEAGWILPRQGEKTTFTEIDVARVRLIRDLTHEMGVNDEGVPIILDLIDQLHGLRRAMRDLMETRRGASTPPGV
jgi:chaperone modulatory protein CbpM